MRDARHPAHERLAHPVALAAALLVALAGGVLALLVVLSVFGFTDVL